MQRKDNYKKSWDPLTLGVVSTELFASCHQTFCHMITPAATTYEFFPNHHPQHATPLLYDEFKVILKLCIKLSSHVYLFLEYVSQVLYKISNFRIGL
jgi:hypothetical protein